MFQYVQTQVLKSHLIFLEKIKSPNHETLRLRRFPAVGGVWKSDVWMILSSIQPTLLFAKKNTPKHKFLWPKGKLRKLKNESLSKKFHKNSLSFSRLSGKQGTNSWGPVCLDVLFLKEFFSSFYTPPPKLKSVRPNLILVRCWLEEKNPKNSLSSHVSKMGFLYT